MSELPKGWADARGEEVFSLVRGVSYKKNEVRHTAEQGYVGVLRATNLQRGEANKEELVFAPAANVSDDQFLRAGDILIATSSGSKTVVGKSAKIEADFGSYSFGAFCSVARAENEDLGRFLSYYFSGDAYRKYVENVALGININNFRTSDLKALPIPLPPLPEQRRIVRKLDTLSARTTTARTHLTAIAKLVEKYREAVLEQAFKGTLTDEQGLFSGTKLGADLLEDIRAERKSHWLQTERAKKQAKGQNASDASILKRYKPPEAVAAVDCPHELPAGWAWAVADEVVQPGADIVYGIVQPGPKLSEGVPYVRGMDIVDGVIQTDQLLKTSPEIAQKYERASLKGGDILLGIIRATKVAIVPFSIEGANITQGTARFRPSSVISTEYLAYWLASKAAQSWLHSKYRGIDMPGLNLRDVRQLPVPLAPLEEQREIVRRIETAFAKIDRLVAEAEKALKLTDRLDGRILAKAFAGELVPQDPTDEPAINLLARIRETRATAPKPKRGRRKKAEA